MEKRQQPRFTSQFRSTISGGQREGQGRTLDLSTGGCKIETDFPVVVGAAFDLGLLVAPPEKVLLNCDVKRGCWRFSIGGSSLIMRG